jgi:SpoVK/Ycf46/Vps4 family AAA+-type ATPase
MDKECIKCEEKMSRRLNDEIEEALESAKKTQWGKVGNVYSVAFPTVGKLPPGYYTIFNIWGELRFVKQVLSTEGIFTTGSPNAKRIIDDFEKFWLMEDRFRLYKMPYKRGFFLSGPPGSGKTCILKILSHLIIKMGGAVIDVREDPHILGEAISAIRDVHSEMPILVALEDLDKYYNGIHENLLNIMDGMVKVDRVVFVATTNYPERFDDSLINRPGRFDGHYRILPPGIKARVDFINEFLTSEDRKRYPILKWAKDTENLPFGHIKELVVSVVVLDNDYDETLERIKNMNVGIGEDYNEDE